MEITDSNFISSIALVKKSIETADFIAMDTEFSGTLPRIFRANVIYRLNCNSRGQRPRLRRR